ncbi:unnamed protein product [Cyclocybe aegerita]|uniref:Uncharacterized protein n=1 Tax=Cyclocybe aegerita TaxID=1973307 RepID=A0A8S0W3M3_CYCAE|nr:unnamed protein product [Cyclocybe aegerita]
MDGARSLVAGFSGSESLVHSRDKALSSPSLLSALATTSAPHISLFSCFRPQQCLTGTIYPLDKASCSNQRYELSPLVLVHHLALFHLFDYNPNPNPRHLRSPTSLTITGHRCSSTSLEPNRRSGVK